MYVEHTVLSRNEAVLAFVVAVLAVHLDYICLPSIEYTVLYNTAIYPTDTLPSSACALRCSAVLLSAGRAESGRRPRFPDPASSARLTNHSTGYPVAWTLAPHAVSGLVRRGPFSPICYLFGRSDRVQGFFFFVSAGSR